MNSVTRELRQGSRWMAGLRMPWAARLVLRGVARLTTGRLRLTLPSGECFQGGSGDPQAEMEVRDWHAFARILRDGDIGLAEGYLDGQWDSPDLAVLLAVLAANRIALDDLIYGSIAGRLLHRLAHALRANTRAGSRRNIARHYDLGNEFYALWLDPGMSYSSALFGDDAPPGRSLQDAQQEKYRRVLEQIDAAPGTHILEIGCGWGGFAELAAGAQCRVTGLSLSKRQLEYAEKRLQRSGLGERVTLANRDYRDERGCYDAVVSIEMFEAVGERWWPTFFERVRAALRPNGKAAIQTIVIADELFERYRKGSDFIQQYIFPGGMLPSASRFSSLAGEAGFEVEDAFRFGADYRRTLLLWRDRFLANADGVRALGFDERFLRMWHFYLAYCAAGFASGATDVVQFTLRRRST